MSTTKLTHHAIVTIEVLGWLAIVLVMGLLLTVIVASIYGSLGVAS